MKRKVVQQGPATLMVSLPSVWVKQNNIKKGQEIELEIHDKQIVLATEIKPEVVKDTVHIDAGNNWFVTQIVRNMYVNGVDELDVTFDEPSVLEHVHSIVDALIGFEIVEESDKRCKLVMVTNEQDQSINEMIQRVLIQIKQLFTYVVEDAQCDEINFNRVKNLRDTIYKFGNLIRRVVVKRSPYESKRNIAVDTLLTRYLMIANNIEYCYRYCQKNKLTLKPVLEEIKVTQECFGLFVKLWKFDYKTLAKINKLRESFVKQKVENSSVKKEMIAPLFYFAECVRLISSSGGAMVRIHAMTKDEK